MKKNRVRVYLLLIILIVTVMTGITAYSLLWTPNNIKLTSAKGEGDILSLIAKEMKLGGTMELNEEEINTLLAQYVKGLPNALDFKVDNITCTLGEEKISFYVQGRYHKLKVYLSCTGKLQYNGEKINYTPDSFKLGRLPVPKKLVFKLLNGHMPISSDKQSLEFDKGKLPVDLESLEIKGKKLHIKFKIPVKNSTSKNNNSQTDTEGSKSNNNKASNDNSPSTKAINDEIIHKTEEQTNKISSQLSTSSEKQLVAMISNLLEKMISDSSYMNTASFQQDVSKMNSLYSKMSEKEKAEVKAAVLEELRTNMNTLLGDDVGTNIDLDSLMELFNLLGI